MYGVMFFEEQDFVGPSETFGLRVVALLPLSIFRVARLKVCFFVPAQAPFNVVTLRNHNTVGVFRVEVHDPRSAKTYFTHFL